MIFGLAACRSPGGTRDTTLVVLVPDIFGKSWEMEENTPNNLGAVGEYIRVKGRA